MKAVSGNGALSSGELADLAKVLRVRDAGGAPCEEVRKLAAQKLVNVQEQLRELTELRDDLQETLRDWDARLTGRTQGRQANLLESLSVDPNPAKRPHHSFKRKRRSE